MRVWAVNSMKSAALGRLAVDGRLLSGQVEDALALGRRVGHRRQAGHAGHLARLGAAERDELRGAAVADGDRARLVEQERVDVAGDLDRLAALGDDVRRQGPVHPRDADRREQGADRRRDQADEQGDQRRDVERLSGAK